jgi:hypothetical protein
MQAGDNTLEEVGTKLRSLAQDKRFVLLLDNAEDCLANAAAADQLSALVSKVWICQELRRVCRANCRLALITVHVARWILHYHN